MDSFVDERDYKLLESDRYTFLVLRNIIGGEVSLLLSDHERLIICLSLYPHPVWIWTPDDASEEEFERAYKILKENALLDGKHTFNVKNDLAAYFIKRAAVDGKQLSVTMNLFAYDCPNPIEPSKKASGIMRTCTEEDAEDLTELLALFHTETGLYQKSAEEYRKDAKRYIDAGSLYFWINEQGKKAASCYYGSADDMAFLNLVYTYKEYRRNHYAENLVYQVTMLARMSGYTPMLYTNADYIASNACYEKIGYVLRGKLCTIGEKHSN